MFVFAMGQDNIFDNGKYCEVPFLLNLTCYSFKRDKANIATEACLSPPSFQR